MKIRSLSISVLANNGPSAFELVFVSSLSKQNRLFIDIQLQFLGAKGGSLLGKSRAPAREDER